MFETLAAVAAVPVIGTIATNLAVNEVMKVATGVREAIVDGRIPIEGPANHDLQRASEASLRGASGILLARLVGDLQPETGFHDLYRRAFARNQRISGGLRRRDDRPGAAWCRAFEKALYDGEVLARFDDRGLLDQRSLSGVAADDRADDLAARFRAAFQDWIDGLDLGAPPPPDLTRHLATGWDAEGLVDGRMDPYRAYVEFFREQLKTDERVRAIYQAVTTAELHRILGEVHADVAELRRGFAAAARSTDALHDRLLAEDRRQDRLLEDGIERYLRWLVDEHAEIRVPPIARRRDPEAAPLRHLELELEVVRERRKLSARATTAAAAPQADAPGPQRGEVGRLDGLLGGPVTRLLLVGPPGSGKTTTLGAFAHRTATALLAVAPRDRGRSGTEQPRFPVLLRCRDLHGHADLAIDQLVEVQLRRMGGTRDEREALAAFFDRALAVGEAVLVVDALDEVADPDQRAALAVLLARVEATTPVLVTSRRLGYEELADSFVDFDEVRVAPLSADAKGAFIRNWLGHGTDGDPSDPSDPERRLVATVTDDSDLARACENILVLALFVQVDLGSTADEPALASATHEIFDRAVRLLIADQRPGRPGVPDLEYDEVVPPLERVAWGLTRAGTTLATRSEVSALVQSHRADPWSTVGLDLVGRRDPRTLVDEIVARTHLLAEEGLDDAEHALLQFFHESFALHLAAMAVRHGAPIPGAAGASDAAPAPPNETTIEPVPLSPPSSGGSAGNATGDGPWLQVVRQLIEALPSLAGASRTDADRVVVEALLALLPTTSTPTGSAVAAAALALRGLAAVDACPTAAAATILEAAVDVALRSPEVPGAGHGAAWHEAWAAVGASPWHRDAVTAHQRRFLASTDPTERRLLGATLAEWSGRDVAALPVDLALRATAARLTGPSDEASLAALGVMELSFQARRAVPDAEIVPGADGHPVEVRRPTPTPGVDDALADELADALLEAVEAGDEASAPAAWALLWLVGARDERADPRPLTEARRARLRALLADEPDDPYVVADLARLLVAPDGDAPQEAPDWLMLWAHTADGAIESRTLEALRRSWPPRPHRDGPLLASLAARPGPAAAVGPVAVAAGRAGVRSAELVDPLHRFLAEGAATDRDARVEAFILLAEIPGAAATEALVALALTARRSDEALELGEYAGLALIGRSDLAGVETLLAADPPLPGWEEALLLVLATTDDPRGRRLLDVHLASPDPARRHAARAVADRDPA